MLTFNLKKEWFEKIKSGEKTHEYREVKPYWTRRFFNLSDNIFFNSLYNCFMDVHRDGKCVNYIWEECEFVCGYASKTDKSKRINAIITGISIINGKNTDLAIDKDVYDIEFEVTKEQTDEK